MSAYLDKSQGITFVFSNIHDLYTKAKEARIDAPFAVGLAGGHGAEPPRVLKKEEAQAEAYRPAELKAPASERPFPVPAGVREAEEKAMRRNMRPIAALQKNLAELTDAQAKLRFLLQELESLTKKK